MKGSPKILVVQTAFIGDVVLTTPLLSVLHSHFRDYHIDVLVIPPSANLLANHPAVREVIVFDKRGTDRGLTGILSMQRRIRSRRYEIAVIPHRSLRSGLICSAAGIRQRISFSTSAASFLMTDLVAYKKDIHEVERNLSLLAPLKIPTPERVLPSLYPSEHDSRIVTEFLSGFPDVRHVNLIALAPGSVWATKRWLSDRFAELAQHLIAQNFSVVLVGGPGDIAVGNDIQTQIGNSRLINAINKLTLLQSAELIRRCAVLISNDSAPLHIGVAMRTPVVAVFGATVPEFGFGPLGEHDEILQIDGLDCRPCSIHGGTHCPIKTFDCMKRIQVDNVLQRIHHVVVKTGALIA